jgi:hypothetical protein
VLSWAIPPGRSVRNSLACCYRREKDPLKLIVVKDTVEHMNAIIDLCGECSESVANVVLRYA